MVSVIECLSDRPVRDRLMYNATCGLTFCIIGCGFIGLRLSLSETGIIAPIWLNGS